MKGSEALLRCIAAEGGTISGTRPDEWMGLLYEAGFIEKSPNFSWTLTEKAKTLLKTKGVKL